jgi:hypothetical protein
MRSPRLESAPETFPDVLPSRMETSTAAAAVTAAAGCYCNLESHEPVAAPKLRQ